MSVADVIESPLSDVSHVPLGEVIESEDSVLRRALDRIKAEASSDDQAASVAAFNSGL